MKHSNSTHKLYISLSEGEAGVGGVLIADSVLNNTQVSLTISPTSLMPDQVRRTEHTRDWIFIPVDFEQLRKVFR